MNRFLPTLFLFLCSLVGATYASQNGTVNWQSAVAGQTIWRYHPGSSDPGNGWINPAFDDTAWPAGSGGFGYGDGDDDVVLVGVGSVFLRTKFIVLDKSKIKQALLHLDFDDGFVAYLNGTEIARANMAAGVPAFNHFSTAQHEALLYQGKSPEAYSLKEALLQSLLVEGENLLAIQVHNSDAASSDLSARAWLSFELSEPSPDYAATPAWFRAPQSITSSNLPIVAITTSRSIPDDLKIEAHMGIIDNGPGIRNNFSDPFNHYDGRIGIEIRGESSQMFPKKSYSLETRNALGQDLKVSLLGFPVESDWVLHAPYSDKTMLRNALSYHLGNKMGHYATRTRFCEVVLNGDYVGVYILMEKIKRDKNRVDIAKLLPEDLSGDDVTGGYILKVDKLDGNDYPAWNSNANPGAVGEQLINYQYYDPKGGELAEAQRTYIKNFISGFESALNGSGTTTTPAAYRRFIDLQSFWDYMLLTELNKDVDGYKYSTFMYKEKDSKGGKLFMGPIWDYNLAFGNLDYNQAAQYAPGWMYLQRDNRMYWFRKMMQDPVFSGGLNCRWQELRQGIYSTSYIHQWIDSAAFALQEAQQRNYTRWPTLSQDIWPNQYVGHTYQNEINWLKNWIRDRLLWMDANFPGNCNVALGTDNSIFDEKALVYPNPSESGFTFELLKPLKGGRLLVYSLKGDLLYTAALSESKVSWNGQNSMGKELAPGIYLYRIESASGTYATGKLMRQ